MALLDGATSGRFRDRWQHLQLRFIDDPQAVAAQAGVLVAEAVTALHDAVDRPRSALQAKQPGDGIDPHARGHFTTSTPPRRILRRTRW